ncbi:MAG: hypothetical protein IJ773_01060 [Lachnospiraceae bacterium]|nr:hypothetical protein [Lachnospiraceae bacterium]
MKNPNEAGVMESKTDSENARDKRLLSAIGGIDEAFIAEADPEVWREKAEQRKKNRKGVILMRFTRVAAAALVLFLGVTAWRLQSSNNENRFFDEPGKAAYRSEEQNVPGAEQETLHNTEGTTRVDDVKPEQSLQGTANHEYALDPEEVDVPGMEAYAGVDAAQNAPEGSPMAEPEMKYEPYWVESDLPEAAEDASITTQQGRSASDDGKGTFLEGLVGRMEEIQRPLMTEAWQNEEAPSYAVNEEEFPVGEEAEGYIEAENPVENGLPEIPAEEGLPIWDSLADAEAAAGFTVTLPAEVDPSWTVSYRAEKGILCITWRTKEGDPAMVLTKTSSEPPAPSLKALSSLVAQEGDYIVIQEKFLP